MGSGEGTLERDGVSFEEAKTVFWDEVGLLLDDPEASEQEHRFVLLGLSVRFRLLVIVHAVGGGDGIRVISARKATRFETVQYETRLR